MKWPEDNRILVETCRPAVSINICVDSVTMLLNSITFTQRNVEGQITREEIRSALAPLSLGLPT
jgi:hypothetical protein